MIIFCRFTAMSFWACQLRTVSRPSWTRLISTSSLNRFAKIDHDLPQKTLTLQKLEKLIKDKHDDFIVNTSHKSNVLKLTQENDKLTNFWLDTIVIRPQLMSVNAIKLKQIEDYLVNKLQVHRQSCQMAEFFSKRILKILSSKSSLDQIVN